MRTRKSLLALLVSLAVLTSVNAAYVPPGDPAAASEQTAYVTKTGQKYHRNHCRYLDHSKRAVKLLAAKECFGPCKVCQPPQ